MGWTNGCTFGAMNAPTKTCESDMVQSKSLVAQPVDGMLETDFFQATFRR